MFAGGLITFYEILKDDFRGEVRRIAAFLGVALPEAKLLAVEQRVALEAMSERGCDFRSISHFFSEHESRAFLTFGVEIGAKWCGRGRRRTGKTTVGM